MIQDRQLNKQTSNEGDREQPEELEKSNELNKKQPEIKQEISQIVPKEKQLNVIEKLQDDKPYLNEQKEAANKTEKTIQISNPIELCWRHLTIMAQIQETTHQGGKTIKKKAQKELLKDISGIIRPGHFTAIMGPSGSGQTTLLNLISGRLTANNIQLYGEIQLNGKTVTDLEPYGNQMAYVMQDDILLPILTPRQAFMFSANIRLKNLSQQEKIKRVNDLIVELGLTRCADTRIGDSMKKGISGGQRKRTSIGVELLTNPSLLFLDEPTTGLDSSTALSVISLIKTLAKKGVNVVSTIHQPSSEIFAEFDQLLLIVAGNIIYQGESHDAVNYFAQRGFVCPKNSNPADYFTQLMNAEGIKIEKIQKQEKVGTEQEIKQEFQLRLNGFVSGYRESDLFQQIDSQLQTEIVPNMNEFNVSTWRQYALVWKRSIVQTIRQPMELKVQIIQSIFMSLVMIIVFNNLGEGMVKVQSTNGAIFFIVTLSAFNGIQGSLAVFAAERPLFLRQRLNQSYTTAPYFWGKTFADFPFDLIYPLLISAICYFAIGLNTNTSSKFWINIGAVELTYFYGASYGLFIACLFPKIQVAMALIPVLVIPLMVMGGLFVNLNQIPYFLYQFLYISMFQYGFQAATINEFTDPQKFPCGTIQLQNGQLIQNYQCQPLRDHDFQQGLEQSLIIMGCLGVFFRIVALILMKQISSPPKPILNPPINQN